MSGCTHIYPQGQACALPRAFDIHSGEAIASGFGHVFTQRDMRAIESLEARLRSLESDVARVKAQLNRLRLAEPAEK